MLRLRPGLHDRRRGILAFPIRPLRRHGSHAHRLHRNRRRYVRLWPQEVHGRHPRDDRIQVRNEGRVTSFQKLLIKLKVGIALISSISHKPFRTRSILADPVAIRVTDSHPRALCDLHNQGSDVDAKIFGVGRIGGEGARSRVSHVEFTGAILYIHAIRTYQWGRKKGNGN